MLSVIIIAICVCLGAGSYFYTKTPDSPGEQIAEAVLKTEGINLDFSPEKQPIDIPKEP